MFKNLQDVDIHMALQSSFIFLCLCNFFVNCRYFRISVKVNFPDIQWYIDTCSNQFVLESLHFCYVHPTNTIIELEKIGLTAFNVCLYTDLLVAIVFPI